MLDNSNSFIIEDEDYDDGSENPTLQLINHIKDTSDLYYISLLLLDKLGESKHKYTVTSELAYLLDLKSFLNLVYYYGGKTVRIPSVDELQNTLRLVSLYYYNDIVGLGWKEALAKVGLPTDSSSSLSYKSKLIIFRRHLNSVRLPQELKVKGNDDNECE